MIKSRRSFKIKACVLDLFEHRIQSVLWPFDNAVAIFDGCYVLRGWRNNTDESTRNVYLIRVRRVCSGGPFSEGPGIFRNFSLNTCGVAERHE